MTKSPKEQAAYGKEQAAGSTQLTKGRSMQIAFDKFVYA